MFNHLQTEKKCQTKEKTLVFHRTGSTNIAHGALEPPDNYGPQKLNMHGKAHEQWNLQAKWAVLIDSTVMAKPMNNETCKTEQGSDRKLAGQSRAAEL